MNGLCGVGVPHTRHPKVRAAERAAKQPQLKGVVCPRVETEELANPKVDDGTVARAPSRVGRPQPCGRDPVARLRHLVSQGLQAAFAIGHTRR